MKQNNSKCQFYLLWNSNHRTIRETYIYPCWNGMLKYRNFHLHGISSLFRMRNIVRLHVLTSSIPFIRAIWYPVYLFNVKDMSRHYRNIVIINEDHPCLENNGFLKYLKRRYHARLVIFAVNQVRDKEKRPHWGTRGQEIYDLKEQTDLIVTADFADAKKFSLEYFPNVYSKSNIQANTQKVDLYYTGRAKREREYILGKVAKNLRAAGIDFEFSLTEVSQNGRKQGIKEKSLRSYFEVLSEVQSSNCLLEILEDRQTSMTLRYMEALCYNKKLLTSNQNIVFLAGYNEQYMKVFDLNHVEDIDIDFIRRRDDVKYDYHDEYSPENFIKMVLKLLKEKERI